jgi:hypothetical protein
MKKLWLVKLNWSGEVHQFYTYAKKPETALQHAFCRLSQLVGYHHVAQRFDGSKANFEVKEVKKK